MWLEDNAKHTCNSTDVIPNSEGVYVYTQGYTHDNIVKIGYSRDVRTRLQQHQSSSFDKIEIRLMLEIDSTGKKWGYNYKRLEKELHERASTFGTHMRGEWYKIDATFLTEVYHDLIVESIASVFYIDAFWMEEIIQDALYELDKIHMEKKAQITD